MLYMCYMLALLVYLEQGKKIQKIDENNFHPKDLRNFNEIFKKDQCQSNSVFLDIPRAASRI